MMDFPQAKYKINLTADILGVETSLRTDPNLAVVRANPNGKLNSLFLNHLKIKQFWAIFIVSPPSPKKTLPTSINSIDLEEHPNENKNCPNNRKKPTLI